MVHLEKSGRGRSFLCPREPTPWVPLCPLEVFRKPSNTDIKPIPIPIWKKREFLASTDERFRPVNGTFGPDGCLYVVDFHRGVIQHKKFLTSYLRRQSEERELDKHIGYGTDLPNCSR